VLPFIPDSLNLPPVILDTGRKPLQQRTQFQVGIDCSTEFVIFVQDDSPTIQHQWFIDPDNTYAPTQHKGTPQTGTASTRRELRPPSGLFTSLSAFTTRADIPHRVEVVITDGDFDEVNKQIVFVPVEQGRDETGDAGMKAPYHVSFTWFGEVKRCP